MKPILFNTEMVRAILDNRKMVTRRVVKPQPKKEVDKIALERFHKPYRPGDILYVREAFFEHKGHYYYKADGKHEHLARMGIHFKWRPSIHMPREAARIFLRVTNVRVERLQECGKGWCLDIEREGIVTPQDPILYINDDEFHGALRKEFQKLWDSTIKPANRALYGWEANPYVWRIEFERCEKPKEETC